MTGHVHSWPVVSCDRCDMTIKDRIEELRAQKDQGIERSAKVVEAFKKLIPDQAKALDTIAVAVRALKDKE